MAKKSFLMVSLEEDKAKQLATVLSNDKCRRILDYLTDNDSVTESHIAEALKLPISTVHYNIQQLLKNGLVNSNEFHYSKKGKEVNHYSLANKYIIISPKPVRGIKGKLKDILPVALIVGAAAGLMKIVSSLISFGAAKTSLAGTNELARDVATSAPQAVAEEAAVEALRQTADEAAVLTVDTGPKAAHVATDWVPAATGIDINIMILCFLVGATFAIIVFLLWQLLKMKK